MNNMDKIQCMECGDWFYNIAEMHLRKCSNTNLKQYREKYPDALLVSEHFKENVKKNHKGMKGKKHTKESKQNISITGKKSYENGRIPPMKGKKLSEETKQNLKIGTRKSYENGRVGANKCRKLSDEWKQNLSAAAKKLYENGRIPPMKGIKFTGEHCKNIRVSTIDYLESCVGKLFPHYSKKACKFFNWFNKEFDLNGQHAENGGEFHIKELGYFLDYYEPDLNLVIEWDEKKHYSSDGKLRERDIQRQREIEEYLGCRLIRINENELNIF